MKTTITRRENRTRKRTNQRKLSIEKLIYDNIWKKKLNVNVQERENISSGNVHENDNEIFKLRCATSDEYVLRCT